MFLAWVPENLEQLAVDTHSSRFSQSQTEHATANFWSINYRAWQVVNSRTLLCQLKTIAEAKALIKNVHKYLQITLGHLAYNMTINTSAFGHLNLLYTTNCVCCNYVRGMGTREPWAISCWYPLIKISSVTDTRLNCKFLVDQLSSLASSQLQKFALSTENIGRSQSPHKEYKTTQTLTYHTAVFSTVFDQKTWRLTLSKDRNSTPLRILWAKSA